MVRRVATCGSAGSTSPNALNNVDDQASQQHGVAGGSGCGGGNGGGGNTVGGLAYGAEPLVFDNDTSDAELFALAKAAAALEHIECGDETQRIATEDCNEDTANVIQPPLKKSKTTEDEAQPKKPRKQRKPRKTNLKLDIAAAVASAAATALGLENRPFFKPENEGFRPIAIVKPTQRPSALGVQPGVEDTIDLTADTPNAARWLPELPNASGTQTNPITVPDEVTPVNDCDRRYHPRGDKSACVEVIDNRVSCYFL